LQEVWLTTSDYEGRKGFSFQKASDGEIRQFILRKVYWLGFNEGDQSTEVWICDPYDAEYLGTTTNHLKQLAQILAAEDLIRFDTTRTFAAASNFLLKQSSMFEEELHAAIEGRPTVGQPYREPDRTTATKPSAFISYSSQDNAFAERLASDLKARKLGVWFDKWEICVGDSLMQKIGQGIRENDYLIVVLSPDSVASEWVKKELAEAMQREIAEKRVVVLPILYRQCQRPPFLADKKYANFTKTYEEGFGELLRGFSLMGGRLIPTESEAVNQPGRVSRPDLADVESGVQATHNETDDRVFERLAIDEARKSVPEDERIHPRVGVVVVKDGRVLATAHRGEIPQCHGEYIALERKLPEVPLPGATVYTTLEPCTSRNHPKVPCAIRLTERKVARVVIGMLDPDIRIRGSGMWTLRQAGIAIELFPHDLMTEIEELNRDFIRERESAQKKGPIPERKRADLVVAVHEGSAFLRHFLNGKPVGTYLHINASVENKGNRGSVVSRYHLRIEETGTNEDVRPNPSSAVQGPKSTWFANTLSKNLAPGGFIRVQPDNLAGPDILPFYVVAVPPEDCHVLHCTLEITDSNGEQAMCEFELHERVQ
jgi:pyrimidine deaminase RibD-like protein